MAKQKHVHQVAEEGHQATQTQKTQAIRTQADGIFSATRTLVTLGVKVQVRKIQVTLVVKVVSGRHPQVEEHHQVPTQELDQRIRIQFLLIVLCVGNIVLDMI